MKRNQWRRAASAVVAMMIAAAVGAAIAVAAPSRTSAAPANTSTPTLQGTFQIGQTITTTNGGWSNSPTQYTYQWQRCNSSGSGCADIQGATSKSYKLTADDVDHTVRVLVTAANSDGKSTVNTKPSPVVSDNSAPRNTARPMISGSAVVGEELKVSTGTFTGGANTYSYQWQRCDETGNNCADVAGATSATYGVRAADEGHTVRVEVTAKNAAGSTSVGTDRSSVVKAAAGGKPAPAPAPAQGTKCTSGSSVAATDLKLPLRLVIDKFSFDPGTVTRGTQAFTGRIHITDTCGRSVVGAQLWSTAIPYNQTNVAQAQTGADGYGTLAFNIQRGFPANPGRQQILAMLVRVKKPGGSVTSGVSTRIVARVNVNLHG